jgi:photosystem II stability/assembly factor-like uncharacterized protein
MSTVVRVALTASLLSIAASALAEPAKLSHRDRLYDVAALDGTLFVVGHPGRLLRSRDGGGSFEDVAAGQNEDALFSVAFNAKGQGAIVGRSGVLLLSDDKGASWKKSVIKVDDELPNLFAVEVLPSGALVAVGEFGAIVRSEDHGKTWSRSSYSIELPTSTVCGVEAEHENSDVVNEARLTDVRFMDEKSGFSVGEFGLIIKTEDGGRTWKRQNSCSESTLYGVSVISAKHLLAVGAEGAVLETTDGGATWKAQPSGTSEHLFGVFADGQRTLVVGAAGTVLARAGAEPLHEAKTGVHTWLTSAWLDSKGKGLIVGGRANLLTTQDGGKTQKRLAGE